MRRRAATPSPSRVMITRSRRTRSRPFTDATSSFTEFVPMSITPTGCMQASWVTGFGFSYAFTGGTYP
jgi:hypothetical protein